MPIAGPLPPNAYTPRAFAGVDRLHGAGSYARLQSAAVAVIGVGGVGSWAAEALARNGIGRITLVDLDQVAESNINRQLQALIPTLGMAKVDALAERLAIINPNCGVTRIEDFVSADNIAAVLGQRPDVVLDCTDQTSAKVVLARYCQSQDLALFMAGAAGGRTDPTRIRRSDLGATQGDALLARVRTLLRKSDDFALEGKDHFGIEAVYSIEPMRRPPADLCEAAAAPQGLSCAGYGSSVCVTGAFGFALAACAIDYLLCR